MASLYSSIGNAQVELGEADKALGSYLQDYQISTNNKWASLLNWMYLLNDIKLLDYHVKLCQEH